MHPNPLTHQRLRCLGRRDSPPGFLRRTETEDSLLHSIGPQQNPFPFASTPQVNP